MALPTLSTGGVCNESFCKVALSVPGFSMPVRFLPSQSNSIRTRLSSPFFTHHSPLQEPFKGWPNCAIKGTLIKRTATMPMKHIVRGDIVKFLRYESKKKAEVYNILTVRL